MFAIAPSLASAAAMRSAIENPAKSARPFARTMRVSDANRDRIRIDEHRIGAAPTEVKYEEAYLIHACNGVKGETRYRNIIEHLFENDLVGDVDSGILGVVTVAVGEERMLLCPRDVRAISRLDANSVVTLRFLRG